MNIRPIKTDADHEKALEEIEHLFDAKPNTPEGDRLDVLTTMVEAYEERRYPIPAPDPIEFILYHIESRGLTRKDLERCIGSRARVSEILNRKRALTLPMIQRLHSELGIAADALITPYRIRKARTRRPRSAGDRRTRAARRPMPVITS